MRDCKGYKIKFKQRKNDMERNRCELDLHLLTIGKIYARAHTQL